MKWVDKAGRRGMGVCWEGDISEEGFSFNRGTASLDIPQGKDVQQLRQRMIENYTTTDEHRMAVRGISRNKSGAVYYLIKFSWGRNYHYGGMMFDWAVYMKLKTVAVFIPMK